MLQNFTLPLSLLISKVLKIFNSDMRFILVPLLLVVVFVLHSVAQDTLPGFSAIIKPNGKTIISWRNQYPIVNQISIQRSADSLKNFKTLLTVPDPTIPENGFVDNKASGTAMFYRLFILLDKSQYVFSKSKRAMLEAIAVSQPNTADTAAKEDITLNRIDNQRIYYQQDNSNRQKPAITGPSQINTPAKVEVEKTVYIKQKDSVIGQVSGKQVRAFRDSVLAKTKDTLLFIHADTILIKAFVPPPVKEVYKVSAYVFTGKDGNVNISLADAARKKYMVKFFEQDNSPLLEIKEIRDALLILDKANFLHSGWFRFELYEDGKLKEKNKLFIPKDF
jgi:hypothetical protein